MTAVDWVFQTRTLLRAILHNPKVLPVVVGRTGVHGEKYKSNDGRYDVRSKEKVRWEHNGLRLRHLRSQSGPRQRK